MLIISEPTPPLACRKVNLISTTLCTPIGLDLHPCQVFHKTRTTIRRVNALLARTLHSILTKDLDRRHQAPPTCVWCQVSPMATIWENSSLPTRSCSRDSLQVQMVSKDLLQICMGLVADLVWGHNPHSMDKRTHLICMIMQGLIEVQHLPPGSHNSQGKTTWTIIIIVMTTDRCIQIHSTQHIHHRHESVLGMA